MILTVKEENGLVYSYICFNVVDEESRLCNDGKYLFINGFWVHEEHRDSTYKILSLFIQDLLRHETTQKVEWVYWERDNGNIFKFPASRFLKMKVT